MGLLSNLVHMFVSLSSLFFLCCRRCFTCFSPAPITCCILVVLWRPAALSNLSCLCVHPCQKYVEFSEAFLFHLRLSPLTLNVFHGSVNTSHFFRPCSSISYTKCFVHSISNFPPRCLQTTRPLVFCQRTLHHARIFGLLFLLHTRSSLLFIMSFSCLCVVLSFSMFFLFFLGISWPSASSTTHRSPSPSRSLPRTRTWDDLTLGEMLTEAYRGQVDYFVQGGVSVSQLSSSVRSDRSGQLDGEMVDRSGQPDECNSPKAQIRTLLEEQRQTIAEYREKVSHHELQAAQAEEERRLPQGQLWQQQLEFREANQRRLTEMEELRKFQSSAFDTIARRKLIDDQNTILELSGRVQELQNEVNCMNDSKDFQDAESIRSGNSHVTSRPVSFPPHPVPDGTWRHSFVSPSRREGPPSILGHTWYIGKLFCKSRCVILSSLSSRIASMEFIDRRAAPFVHSGEKWKARTKSGSEMPVWTVSQRFGHLQWRRLFKELWGRPTTTADFGSSLWQIPHTSYVCLLEDKIQDRGMYLFTIPTEAMQWIKEKWRWLIQWMI